MILESVVRQIVTLDDRAEGSYVTTPLVYPSGASAVVRVEGGPDRFLVSDFGMAHHEADMIGAAHQFSRLAKDVAERAGAGFDEHAFFIAHAVRAQLPGAIITVANCSHEAVLLASAELAEKGASDAAARLYERLVRVFDRRSVARDAEVKGSSNTSWPVAALVKIENNSAVFESVTRHRASVVNAAAKFHDIASLEFPPSRTAVVELKENFGTYLAVLSQAASVVERTEPDETFRRLARAA